MYTSCGSGGMPNFDFFRTLIMSSFASSAASHMRSNHFLAASATLGWYSPALSS